MARLLASIFLSDCFAYRYLRQPLRGAYTAVAAAGYSLLLFLVITVCWDNLLIMTCKMCFLT